MRSRALGAFLLLLILTTGPLVLAPAATASAGPNTSWAMASDHGDWILAGQPYAYDAASGMQLEGSSTRIQGVVDGWHLSIEPADGDVLAEGRTYTGATRTPFHAPGESGLELYGHGRGCNTLTGSFTLHELSFDLGGQLESLVLTFTQHCEGGTPAAYGSIAWHSSGTAPQLPPTVAAPPVPPTLTAKVAGKHVEYGKKVTVQVQLGGGSPNREVAVYARTSNGQEHLLTRATVDASGHLAVPVALTETTTFVVRFHGGGTFPDLEDTSTVTVGAKLRSVFLDRAPKRGKFRLFKASGDATVGALLLPNHAGDCIRFRVQFQPRGSWGYDAVTKCLRLNKNSATGVRLGGDPRLVGIPIRVRPEWKGDQRNTRANGKWSYFRFVR